MPWSIYLIIVFAILLGILGAVLQYFKIKKIKEQINGLANNTLEMTPIEFFKMRNFTLGGRGKPKYALRHNFEGIYIIYNKTKEMHYIGQAQKCLDRVNSHFTGKGNGDVYADYKYGDDFSIKMIKFSKSNFNTLNELERNTIMTYKAFSHGYNKTRGNR